MVNFLDEYRRKRSPGRTPEPFGAERPESLPSAPGAAARTFCVQLHAARQRHHDLRLEWDGVLKSWAVPQGPSYDQKDKRLAMMTEDHPLEYATFEGVIPEGEYGAGEMIVWDVGRFEPAEDFAEGFRKGKLLFDLYGYKLRGRWTLVRIKDKAVRAGGRDEGRTWLFIKERDAHEGKGVVLPPQSVLTGRTVEALRDGTAGDEPLQAALAASGGVRARVEAAEVSPMLAESRDEPFSREGYLFELKYDGFRMIAQKSGPEARLYSRRGLDASAAFPEVLRALRALPHEHLVLDGEVVVLDAEGRPEFQKLQKRALLTRAADIERAALTLPATLYLFDLLGVGDFDLRGLPLRRRKELLEQIAPRLGPLRFTSHIEQQGEALFALVREKQLEGMVAKKADSTYRAGRSADWLKVRIEHVDDFAVVGFTLPKGGRQGIGSLHLGGYRGDTLVYCGRAGTGFTDAQLSDLRGQLERARVSSPLCTGPVPKGKEHVWVKPALVAQVRYRQLTDDGLLRQPAFERLRDDKRVEECALPGAAQGEAAATVLEAAAPKAPAKKAAVRKAAAPPKVQGERRETLSNPDKIFWPAAGYRKRDLYDYYRLISPWLLPYLRDRPLVLTRYPDGIEGKSFYQKDAPEFVPPWIRTVRVFSEETARDIDFFVADDVESLLYLVNLGTIPLHVWSSRARDLSRPDWCILDLDPKGAPFADVLTLANAAHTLCDELGLPSYCKTSGQAGLHVLVPLGAQLDHQQATALAELLARTLEAAHGAIATTVRKVEARGGKVYLDYLQNGHGKTIAGPFSARPVPAASVSMPLDWSEVNEDLDPKRFTIRTAVSRMEQLGKDPLRGVLEEKPDLDDALARLSKRLGSRRK